MKLKDMPKSKNLFKQHPHAIGETFGEHFGIAMGSGLRLMWAGFACCIHSLLPFMFINTASNTVEQINREMTDRKNKRSDS